eukprot:TRINITY_DN1124_c0_g1_i3.p1 TRINITY_DN1124_c0_g1~~TRINITY_DN1124_c0_g1_i3.p1  ORF type:complete len:315 (+),score=68.39 TRINITY_DN1124_c0_g1_i3:387-1331(+)
MHELNDNKGSLQANMDMITFCSGQADTHHLKKSDGTDFNLLGTWDPLCKRTKDILMETKYFAHHASNWMKAVACDLQNLPPDGCYSRECKLKSMTEDCNQIGRQAEEICCKSETLAHDLQLFNNLLNDWVTAAKGPNLLLTAYIDTARKAVQCLTHQIFKLEEVTKGLDNGLATALMGTSIAAALVSCIPFVGTAVAASVIANAKLSFIGSIASKEKELTDVKNERATQLEKVAVACREGLLQLVYAPPAVMQHVDEVTEIVDSITRVFSIMTLLLLQLCFSGIYLSEEDIRYSAYTITKIAETMDLYTAGFEH